MRFYSFGDRYHHQRVGFYLGQVETLTHLAGDRFGDGETSIGECFVLLMIDNRPPAKVFDRYFHINHFNYY